MCIRVPGRDVRVVQLKRGIDKIVRHRMPGVDGLQEIGYGLPPGLVARALKHSLRCFLCRLLGGEARPLEKPSVYIMAGMIEV